MINSIKKGNRNQRKTAKWFEDRGCLVETAKFTRYGSTDYFNLWDHCILVSEPIELNIQRIGHKKGELIYTLPKGIAFVQTKTNKLPSKKERAKYYDFNYKEKFFFVWKDRVKDPIIHLIINNEDKYWDKL